MYPFACLPRSVCCVTFARNMSPVEMNGSWKSDFSLSACVPLPAPGGPNRIRLSSVGHRVHHCIERRFRVTDDPTGELAKTALRSFARSGCYQKHL